MSAAGVAAWFSKKKTSGQESFKDTPELFAKDISENGCWINDKELVYTLVKESGDTIVEAIQMGVPFEIVSEGLISQRRAQGHSAPRVCQVVGGGPALMKILCREVRQKGVRVLEKTPVIQLLTENRQIMGALALDLTSGKWICVRCKSAVLAAGGAGALYTYSSSKHKTTGDAFALAFDAGCLLANMEFVEFTLIPMPGNHTISMGGLGQFVARGGVLLNSENQRFLARYDAQRMELTTKSLLSRAVFEEISAGRGPIRMNFSSVSSEQWLDIRRKTPHMFLRLKRAGWRSPAEDLCWVPAVHFYLGGILTDSKSETSLRGLFAAGECANGIHGAERLAGNALIECLVFGRRAGRFAAEFALSRCPMPWNDKLAHAAISNHESKLHSRSSDQELNELRGRLQKITWDMAGVVKNEEGLNRCEEELNKLLEDLHRLRVGGHKELVKWSEVKSLETVGRLIAIASRARTESRGAHRRSDYPERNDRKWRQWNVLSQENNRIIVDTVKPDQ